MISLTKINIISSTLVFFVLVNSLCHLAIAEDSTKSKEQSIKTTLLDAVVASVSGKPITLSEVNSYLPDSSKVELDELAKNADALQMLNQLIDEKLLLAEAELRRLSVDSDDISFYLRELAERNKMSMEEFLEAVEARGIDQKRFKEQARNEILKSRIGGQLKQAVAAVDDKEIDEYLKQKGKDETLTQKLSIVRLYSSEYSCEDLRRLFQRATRLSRLKSQCEELQIECIELGAVSLSDLSTQVKEQVRELSEGEYSSCSEFTNDLFFLIEREHLSSNELRRLREEAKLELIEKKKMARFTQFLSDDIYKRHSVERLY